MVCIVHMTQLPLDVLVQIWFGFRFHVCLKQCNTPCHGLCCSMVLLDLTVNEQQTVPARQAVFPLEKSVFSGWIFSCPQAWCGLPLVAEQQAELIASNRNSLCREKLLELMLIVLVSEQSISIRGHYSSSFLYLMQNIIVSKENGK